MKSENNTLVMSQKWAKKKKVNGATYQIQKQIHIYSIWEKQWYFMPVGNEYVIQ